MFIIILSILMFILGFLNEPYLCVPVAFVQSLSFVNSKYTPCDLQSRIQSTVGKKNIKMIFSLLALHIFNHDI